MDVVAEADSGDDLVGLVSQHRPGIAVTSYKMPVITGEDLISRVKDLEPAPAS